MIQQKLSELAVQAGVEPEDEHSKTTRRDFSHILVAALTSVIGGGVVVSGGTYLFGNPKEHQETWADAGEVSGLQQGAPEEIVFEKVSVDGWQTKTEKTSAWVVLGGDGRVAAFSPQCTHLGCPYHWEAERKQFVCPCHGSCFDSNGEVMAGPALRPLDRFQIRMEANRLWLGPVQVRRNS